MKQLLLFICIGLLPFLSISQTVDRVVIDGSITAPEGEDTEGISIYNISSQKGTVTDNLGNFTLEVAENDRIQVTALQFQKFIAIVDQGVVEGRQMHIYMNPAITQLEEVIVRPYDLSGNIIADLNRIKTHDTTVPWDLSWESLTFKYEFSDDESSGIKGNKAEEALFNGQQQYAGVNAIKIFRMIFPKKNGNERTSYATREEITNAVRQRFSNTYLVENFGIPEGKVNEFIFFVEEKGIPLELLKEENELQLLELLMEQSLAYKEQLEEN